MFLRVLITVLIISCGCQGVTAKEKVREVVGEYVYFLPRNVARDKGEQIALQRAMTAAIAAEFGTLLSENTRVEMRSGSDGESSDYWSSASMLVRGEWIETIGQPQFGCRVDDDDIVITCRVRGRAREIATNKADIQVRLLRNDASTEDNTFVSGDRLMLGFTAAVDGYLTVYYEDESRQVYRMLPFYSDRSGAIKVEGGRDYIFFASASGDDDQYTLTTDRRAERGYIYVIFSPDEYTKPIDRRSDEELGLRELTGEAFSKWLDGRRAADPHLQISVSPLSIVAPVE